MEIVLQTVGDGGDAGGGRGVSLNSTTWWN